MKAIVDDKIPYIREALALMGVDRGYGRGACLDRPKVGVADAL